MGYWRLLATAWIGGALSAWALPASYNLNEHGLLTPVKNQGALGTCWAFADTTVFQSSLLKQGLVTLDSPELNLSVWHLATANGNETALVPVRTPDGEWDYPGWGGSNEYGTGYWTRGRGLWLLRPEAGVIPAGGGPVLTSSDPRNRYPLAAASQHQNLAPYVPPSSQPQAGFILNQAIILNWNKNPDDLPAYWDRLKQALLKYGALSVYVWADNSETDRGNPVWLNTHNRQDDHAVTLVGWDDTKVLTYDGHTYIGGWYIQNSWGVTNGDLDPYTHEKGYYWVPFADTSLGNVKQATALVTQRNIHEPSGLIYSPTVIQNQIFTPDIALNGNQSRVGNSIGILNQTAQRQWVPENSVIGGIGLWQTDADTTLKIQIYTQWSDGPVNGSNVWTDPWEVTLNEDGHGYNLVELEQPLFWMDGSPLYVFLDYGTDYDTPIGVDSRSFRMIESDRGSYLGVSWRLDETGAWQDIAIFDSNPNTPTGVAFMKLLRLQIDLDNHDPIYPVNPLYSFTVDGTIQSAAAGATIRALDFYDGGALNLNGPLTVTSGIFNVDFFYEVGVIQGTSTVTAPGGFVKAGDGSLQLYSRLETPGNAQIFSGDLTIHNRMAVGGSFIIWDEDSIVTVQSDALLDVRSNTYLNGGYLDLAGTLRTNELIVNGGELWLFSGGKLLVNTLSLTSGVAKLDGTQTIPGPVTVGPSAELDILPGANIRFGQLAIPGGYAYVSAGSTLNVTGSTLLTNEGSLEVDGSLISSSVWIGPTAWLQGSGFITANVTNEGFIAPGNSPGTLTINGNFTQTSNGAFLLEIASAEVFDRLIVNGVATLAGDLVVEPFAGFAFSFGDSFEGFLQAESVAGAFDSIDLPKGFRGRVLEAGGDLTLLVAPASYTQVAVTANQFNAAQALDGFIPATSGDRFEVSTALDRLTAAEYPAAFDAISPAFYESLASMNIELIFSQGQQMQQRFRSVQLGRQSGLSLYGIEAPVLTEKSGGAAKETGNVLEPTPDNQWGIWVQGNGIFSNQASVNNVPGYRSNSGGFLGGVDYRWGDAFATGLYAGYQGVFADYDGGGRTVLNGVRFGGYASYGEATGFFANAMVGGGYTSYTVNRPISFGDIERTAKSAPGGGDFETMLNLGYNWQLGNFNFGPAATAQYTRIGVAPFTENGADSLDLAIGQQSANSLRTLFGGQVAYFIKISPKWAVIPQASFYWQHEFMQNPRTIDASLDGGSGPGFAYRTAAPSRDSVYAETGVTVQLGERWNTNFSYYANFGRQDFVSHQITGGIGLSW